MPIKIIKITVEELKIQYYFLIDQLPVTAQPQTCLSSRFFRKMKRKRGGNEGERRTKWLQLDVETKRKRGRIIYRRCDML